VRLRPFNLADLDALYAIQSRQDVMRYLYGEPRSLNQVHDVLAERSRRSTIEYEGDRLFLAIERRDTGAMIGDVSLYWASAEHKQGEIGYVLHPEHQGQGLGREAAAMMLELGFYRTGTASDHWKV
jgi:RimJ/RimL family protein N-acetyltransferase